MSRIGEIFLRVISGSMRGKKLLCLDAQDVRPTLDRVKESVFNMIAFDLPNSFVLDLFSGSGALGIEALSRGASKCVFVDNSQDSVMVTKKNLEATNLASCALVVKCDSIDFLEKTDKIFDIIFIDPPYNSTLYEEALLKIRKNNLLADDGLIVIEYDANITPPFDLCGYKVIRDKKYGRVKILLMKE